MSTYYPDRWMLVKLTSEGNSHYRVFATWHGGYTSGDSWKLNSGITKVSLIDDCFHFEGSSGSTYVCHTEYYGTSMYGQSVINKMIEESKETVAIDILDESVDPLTIDYK